MTIKENFVRYAGAGLILLGISSMSWGVNNLYNLRGEMKYYNNEIEVLEKSSKNEYAEETIRKIQELKEQQDYCRDREGFYGPTCQGFIPLISFLLGFSLLFFKKRDYQSSTISTPISTLTPVLKPKIKPSDLEKKIETSIPLQKLQNPWDVEIDEIDDLKSYERDYNESIEDIEIESIQENVVEISSLDDYISPDLRESEIYEKSKKFNPAPHGTMDLLKNYKP